MTNRVPVIAILAQNSLMGLGLRSIIERMLPFAVVKVCGDFSEIENTQPEELFHIFVAANIIVEHNDFFEVRRHKSIALTMGSANAPLLNQYPQINIAASNEQIEAAIARLHSAAHGAPHTVHAADSPTEILTPREVEVLKLLVEGLLNKEIAERLSIGLTTVISHRKNIVEKLGVKSLAGLTIYAVMKRYIAI